MPMRCRKALLVVVADAALAWPSLVGAEPYAGLFAGIAFPQRSDIEEPFVESRTNIFAESMTFEDTDVRLGFQGTAGLRFFLTRHIAVFTEYFKLISDVGTFNGSPTVEVNRLKFHLSTHMLQAGLAYHW